MPEWNSSIFPCSLLLGELVDSQWWHSLNIISRNIQPCTWWWWCVAYGGMNLIKNVVSNFRKNSFYWVNVWFQSKKYALLIFHFNEQVQSFYKMLSKSPHLESSTFKNAKLSAHKIWFFLLENKTNSKSQSFKMKSPQRFFTCQ